MQGETEEPMAKEDDAPQSYRDALDQLQYGASEYAEDEPEETEEATPAPEGEAEGPDTPEAPDESQDKPEDGPESEEEPESAEDDAESVEDEEAPGEESPDDSDSGDEPESEPPAGQEDDEPEPEEDEDEEGEQPTVTLKSGEEVTLSQLKEKYENWQSEYSRQRQQDRETVQEYQERLENTQTLADDIAEHSGMQEFLRHHPDGIRIFLRNPEATRELMSDSDALEEFWEEYELLKERPQLAEKYLSDDGREEVSEEVQQRQRVQHTAQVAKELDRVVEAVGEEFEEIDNETVGRDILEMVGVTEEAIEANPQIVHGAMDRLYSLMFVQTDEGLFIDPKLVKDRFEVYEARRTRETAKEEAAAEQQNEAVDAELERKKDRPPAPQGDDAGPSEPGSDEPEPKDFQDALQRVQRMHD
jgi:hypothetical protein